jgi:NAD(P)-dependent dehydrogenase (short-subunit alcohol dehydrogenase family)
MSDTLKNKHVLITGGTSGLGRSLVIKFLSEGYNVYAIGREDISDRMNNTNLTFVQCDFANLSHVKEVGNQLVKMGTDFSFIINNAGILSPPDYQQTIDGFELSYQVNFLSHVLLTTILLAGNSLKPECIVNISSALYVRGEIAQNQLVNKKNYSGVQAYAQSKLFTALFSEKLHLGGNSSFCFNPGTFSSGIYRMQKKWFHHIYKIAAPFMVSAKRVADGLFQILENKQWEGGKMMDRKGSAGNLKYLDPKLKNTFWEVIEKGLSDLEK